MDAWRENVELRAIQYAERHDRVIEKELGFGYDGIVFSTTCQSAIKVLRYEPLYQRERDIYMRLQEAGVSNVVGFDVPLMTDYDDELWVVEMGIVSPPFVLDFAGAYLDRPPDFPDEVMEEWRKEKKEQFGDRWPQVQEIMREFRKMGIYLADVKPGNIMFRE
jgi:hypothetical protein